MRFSLVDFLALKFNDMIEIAADGEFHRRFHQVDTA
jgi:hypothetical protein